jgi:Pyruvate/2-oxoacid:ferredoxin oxidoreductase delta subunit
MSKVFIHYFSGTGNTKRAVDVITGILEKSGFEVKQFAIGKVRPEIKENADYNIFAFSILSWSAPVLVKKYLRRLPQGGGNKAAAFAVYAGDPGGALSEVARLLAHKQFEVFLTGGALYPNNWCQMSNPPAAAEIKELLTAGDNMAQDFAANFLKSEPKLYQSGSFGNIVTHCIAFFFGLLGRRFLGKTYIADSKCNNCGLCIKSCPVHTITMAGMLRKKPHWSFNCEDCARCINICSRKAIQVSIPRLLFHLLIYIAGVWACFPVAGLVATRLPGPYRIIGWITALGMSLLIVCWFQFTVIDRLLFVMEQIPGLRKFFEWNFTKNHNRYIAPGFKPEKF